MSHSRLPTVLSYLTTVLLLASCSSGGSGESAQVPIADTEVLFPELQGSWAKDCVLFDEEQPTAGFERSVVTVTGNEWVIDTKIFTDSNCVTPLPLGFLQLGDDFQSYANLTRPDGAASTSVGAVPYVNIAFQRFTIEDEPLAPAAAALNTPYVDYTIVYVDGNQMFLGDSEVPGQLGDTAATRSVTLDFEDPLVRQ